MPFALVVLGLLMIVSGARGTYAQFGAQVASDFTGKQSFLIWLAALGGLGAVGYIEALQGLSRALMALVIIVMVLANKGVWAQFTQALAQGPKAPVAPAAQQSASQTLAGTGLLNQGGAQGQQPTNPGQATFNGWMNYLFGTTSPSSGTGQ